jgi:thiamine-monophosphate kinase
MGEFDLIARYFQRGTPQGNAVALGIGDDCAFLTPRAGTQLAISSDMLVEGRHFLSTSRPRHWGTRRWRSI